jgi:hypothetical protein
MQKKRRRKSHAWAPLMAAGFSDVFLHLPVKFHGDGLMWGDQICVRHSLIKS